MAACRLPGAWCLPPGGWQRAGGGQHSWVWQACRSTPALRPLPLAPAAPSPSPPLPLDTTRPARSFLPHIGRVTIIMNDYPMFKYALIAVLAVFVLTSKE